MQWRPYITRFHSNFRWDQLPSFACLRELSSVEYDIGKTV